MRSLPELRDILALHISNNLIAYLLVKGFMYYLYFFVYKCFNRLMFNPILRDFIFSLYYHIFVPTVFGINILMFRFQFNIYLLTKCLLIFSLGSEGPVLTESYSFDSNENMVGQSSSLNGIVGFSPSNEMPHGIVPIHHQLSSDNFLQPLNSLGVNSAPSSGSIECNGNMSVSSTQTTQSPIIQQKTCESEQIDMSEYVEYCLWIDLIWLSNQAMAALVCCGPIFDRSALLPQDSGKLNQIILGVGSDASSVSGPERLNSGSGSNVRTPSSGYVLRWISGLLVARDTALSSSPWLWFCPITGRGLLHSTLTPGGASLCGNSHTRSRMIAAGGGRRLDSVCCIL